MHRALRLAFLLAVAAVASRAVTLTSPSGTLVAEVSTTPSGALVYTVRHGREAVIEPSRIGVTVDGVAVGETVSLGTPGFSEVDETYPTVGGKRVAVNRARALRLPLTIPGDSAGAYVLEARAFDDGFAWRLCGAKPGRVTAEASSWTLPAGSHVWFFERDSDWKLKSYAGDWRRTVVDNLPRVSRQGPVQGPPLVVELPGGGYALISEAALHDYSGLRLRAVGERRVRADFTEGAAGFVTDGPVTTPWRLTIDPVLFADAGYIRPGRSVWREAMGWVSSSGRITRTSVRRPTTGRCCAPFSRPHAMPAPLG